MSLLNNYLCHVIGESPADFQAMQKTSRQRIIAFSTAIHLPVLLWLASAILVANRVAELDIFFSIIIGIAAALSVYLIERIVIAAPKSNWITSFRIIISLVMAFLGATFVDIVVFRTEIYQQMHIDDKIQMDGKKFMITRLQNSPPISVEQTKAEQNYIDAKANYLDEINGKESGTGRPGSGPIASIKYSQMISSENKLIAIQEINKLQVNSQIENLSNEIADIQKKQHNGILIQIEALHSFVKSKTKAFYIWLAFILFVLSIELMVLILKLCWPETIDEYIEKQREVIVRKKAEYYTANYEPDLINAQKLLLEI